MSVLLAPFAEDMKIHGKTYLIIVRGINRGCEVYLHLLKYLNSSTLSERQIAFYNRNTSEERKLEILQDLKLPIRSQSKQYRCVVATVSLGVGVDVRVHNTVVLGLSENVENLLQEAGRSMRGGAAETGGDRGISFFLHKGTLGKFIVFFDDYCYYMILVSESKHCPSTSDCRDLITKPLPICQTKTLIQMFDKDVNVQLEECSCCFGCIHRHSNEGCLVCLNFIHRYFPSAASNKHKKSVYDEMKCALTDLFSALELSNIRVENDLSLDCKSFIKDLLRVVDEVQCSQDIVRLWHIDKSVAVKIFSVLQSVLEDDDLDVSSMGTKVKTRLLVVLLILIAKTLILAASMKLLIASLLCNFCHLVVRIGLHRSLKFILDCPRTN